MAIMPNKTWENNNIQGKKKMVVKIGGGAGGGIGAFVLLGGALATAALVSAFVVGRTGRSSGKDRRQNPPPEIKKQNEQDGAVLDHHQSSDVGGVKTEVVEPDTDTEKVSIQKSAPDQKHRVEEINGGKADELDDVEAISDRSDITEEGFPLSDDNLPLDDDAVEKIPLNNEDVVSNEISKEIGNLEHVCIEEEEERETNEMQPRQEEMIEVNEEEDNGVEGVRIDQIEVQRIDEIKSNMEEQESKDFCSDNKEIAIESIKVDLAAIGLELSESDSSLVGVSESQSESGVKAFVPMFDSRVIIEHENVDGDEKERALPVEEEDEANEGSQEEQVKYIEEQLVKEDQIPYENRGFEEPMLKEELILHEDVEVVEDDGAIEEEDEGIETNEEKEKSMQLVNSQPEDDDAEENIAEEIKEELISHADVEVVKEEIANEKVVAEMNGNEALMQFVVVDQPKLGEGDYLIIMETSEDEANCKDNIKKIDYDEDETVLSDEVEETSEGSGDSSMESNSEAVYPVDSPQGTTTVEPRETELLNQEVEGKIQEDKAIKKDDSQFIGDVSETQKVKSLNETFIEKYVEKNRRTYSTRQRMLIGILCALSSLSCSWFFGLSSAELCLVVFLTVVLSTMVTSRRDCKLANM